MPECQRPATYRDNSMDPTQVYCAEHASLEVKALIRKGHSIEQCLGNPDTVGLLCNQEAFPE